MIQKVVKSFHFFFFYLSVIKDEKIIQLLVIVFQLFFRDVFAQNFLIRDLFFFLEVLLKAEAFLLLPGLGLLLDGAAVSLYKTLAGGLVFTTSGVHFL